MLTRAWVDPATQRGSSAQLASFLYPFHSAQEHSLWDGAATFRVTLPTSLNPFWKHSDRHTQRCVSLMPEVFLNPIR